MPKELPKESPTICIRMHTGPKSTWCGEPIVFERYYFEGVDHALRATQYDPQEFICADCVHKVVLVLQPSAKHSA